MILTAHSCFIVCEKLFFLSWLNPCSNLKAAGLIINVAYSHGSLDSVPSAISCFFFDINYSADVVVTRCDMLWPLVTWDGVKSKISPEWCCHCQVDPTVPFPLIIAVSEAGCRFRLLGFCHGALCWQQLYFRNLFQSVVLLPCILYRSVAALMWSYESKIIALPTPKWTSDVLFCGLKWGTVYQRLKLGEASCDMVCGNHEILWLSVKSKLVWKKICGCTVEMNNSEARVFTFTYSR